MRFWKCLEADCQDGETYFHKGLCRSCTEYSETGEVLNAVSRIRVTQSGTPYETYEARQTPSLTKRDFVDARRRKMTNKERAYITEMYEQAHNIPHVHDEHCGHEIEPNQELLEIGESLTVVEDSFNNLVSTPTDAMTFAESEEE